MRRDYWSCTKFADWLRGTPKLKAGTVEEWNAWEKVARTKNLAIGDRRGPGFSTKFRMLAL